MLWNFARVIAVLAVASSFTSANVADQKSAAAATVTHTPGPRITVLGVSNAGKVNDHLYRGGQPKGAGYANLKKLGIDMVVDVRLSGKGKEKDAVNRAGMEYVAIPWHCFFPKDKVFARFLELLRENPDKKIFVHCRYGDDRTGMMIAAYRMAIEGWSTKEARTEMEKFGFHKLVCPRLGPYEHDFPRHLQKGDDFKVWREETATVKK